MQQYILSTLKFLTIIISIVNISACTTIATDPFGNSDKDVFAENYSDTISIKENGSVKVINKNVIKACNFSSLDTARQEAYALALDTNSTQNISGNSRISCQQGSWNAGCVQELDSYSVMYDKKLVNTEKQNDCYIFTFKHVAGLKQTQSSETYSSFNRTNSKRGESLLKINFVNVNSSVRVKFNGKDIYINNNDEFEIVGPKDIKVEVIDARFSYKSFTIKIPKTPKLITKNISLVQLKRKETSRKEVGAGFEKQDYKVKYWLGGTERKIIVRNRHDFDPRNDVITNLHSGSEFDITYENIIAPYMAKMTAGRSSGLSVTVKDNITTDQHTIKQGNIQGSASSRMTLQLVFYGENVEKLLTVNLFYTIYRDGNNISARYSSFDNYSGPKFAKYHNSYQKYNVARGNSPFYIKQIPQTYDGVYFDTGIEMNVSKVEVKVLKGWQSL